jgi:hypothetical protein
MQFLHLILLSYLSLAACHQAHPQPTGNARPETGSPGRQPGQLGHPGPWANLGNVTRCKMFGRPNIFRQSRHQGEPPGAGAGLHNEAGLVSETGTSPAVLPLPGGVAPGPPAAYLRLSTGNLITTPPAWPPWGWAFPVGIILALPLK